MNKPSTSCQTLFWPIKKSLLFLLVGYVLGLSSCQQIDYDLLIQNGHVIDGTGTTAQPLDIAIKGERIVQIAPAIQGDAAHTIDAKGLVISPGFIDLHTHTEVLPLYPLAESHIRQGVTTVLGGPDGGGPIPLGPFLDTLEKNGVGLNVGYLTGHNTIRNEVMGLIDRKPTPEELAQMQSLVKQSMQGGAFGISTGLKYLPGAYSELEEVIALSKTAGQFGGFYTSHLREEGLGLIAGVEEAITIAAEAEMPVVLTHHKVVGQPMWGASKQTLALVDSARNAGLDVMIDQYPYTASFTSISILIPAWAMEGGRYDQFAQRCQNPILRDSIKKGIMFNLINDRGGNDLRRVQFSIFNYKPELEGKTLYDWALMEEIPPTIENGAELVIEAQLNRGARCIFHAMDIDDVKNIMAHPQTMIASDGRVVGEPNSGHPHPRVYGTFPRVLGHFVRNEKVFPLEKAIYKMTGLPAKRMGLQDRGQIKTGHYADLTIFNPQTIIDKATFEAPHQYPEGIDYVIINGQIALEKGIFHQLTLGKILRGPAYGGL